ncbi:MAG TPA: efflux transporter outer membrane subunit, partial [Verrucomicrobiae bacterium]
GSNAVLWKVAEPSAQAPRGNWWKIFGDAGLDRLQTLAATNNQNLVAAAARWEQSRDLLTATRSYLYPQLTLGGTPNGDISRQRTSVNQPVSGKASGVSHTYDTFTAPIYLGWEVDLWGRVRRQVERSKAESVAAADELESAKLAVSAEVAVEYFAAQTLSAEYALLTNTVETYRRSLELTQNRRRGGVVSDLDVAQAATQLHVAETQLPELQLRREQTLHALAILCGQSPIGFSVASDHLSGTVPEVPVTVPAELLEHRPDIAAAERRMAAANASVGVAQAAFFPAVRINGLAGMQSISASSWFDWPSRIWAVGPTIEFPLFTGGLNRANLAAARAGYSETVATYRQTVLTAFGEVQNQLAAQNLLASESEAEDQAVAAAEHALEIANNRYRAGLITYLDVATAQTAALNQQRAAVQLRGARLTASVDLIKALGGGWQQ